MRFCCRTRQGLRNRHGRDVGNRQMPQVEMKTQLHKGRKSKRHGSEVFEAPWKGLAMSRVYNVLTGAPRPTNSTTIDPPDEEVWVSAGETPFVEIGGPTGPVFSALQATPRTITDAKIEAKTETVRSFPRLVSTPSPAY